MEVDPLDSKALFKTHYVCWRVLGILPPDKHRHLFRLYTVLFSIVITIGYPLHLVLGLMTTTTMYEIIQNLSTSVTCTVCAIKTMTIWSQFYQIGDMFNIVRRQDERIRSEDEYKYMKTAVYPSIRHIFNLFYVLCVSVGLTGEFSIIFFGLRDGDWRLIYQAYFPFDPFASTLNYFVAHVYQWVGMLCMIVQNLVNDTFGATHLALLGGQVHLLGMRVAKIGHDPTKTKKENNQALLECIHDHKDLLKYRQKLEDVVSMYMFLQIFFAGINMCVVLAFAVLYAEDPFTQAYYASFFLGMVFEILASCYYGQILEDELQDITYALFACNWIEQDLEFKKNLRIFAETARRRIYLTAWLFRVNNNAFIIACKNAYSLFALIMNKR